MKKQILLKFVLVLLISVTGLFHSCKEDKSEKKPQILIKKEDVASPKTPLSKEFKDYWYSSTAEITSYELEQARYGELRNGKSVLIFVTEPLNPTQQVKADKKNPDNVPVLKLNSTKNYLTGIYPYSIMSSSFYPVHDNHQALKISFSAQEWCGQVFAQLNNRDAFEVTSFSYFESEGDQTITLEKNHLENEIWNRIRINPKNLPIGNIMMIPSLEYIRLSHKELKAYNATTHLTTNEGLQTYTINYEELNRTLIIEFDSVFPYTINGWTETFESGFGAKAKTMITKAKKIKLLRTPYWQQNDNIDISLRDTLGL